jgi:ribonucleoside-diphosphate reductase alpha chain
MGLSLNEDNREERAIEFYNLLSSFDYMASTPTLFNSGTLRPQLSSCYLTTIDDDLYTFMVQCVTTPCCLNGQAV